MGLFDGKVAIVTGAGRGIGREEALLLASEGAAVVVNDLGGARSGEGTDAGPAQEVVDEITKAGGKAAANTDDISSWTGAEQLINQAVEEFGGLDVLVNNAGILRDKMSFNMTEDEWDAVIQVHLKGHFAPSHFAASYWRGKSKETGEGVNAKIVNTASESGLYGNAGQANYAAAKAGIAAMTIVMGRELERAGVRVNAIAPVALTRLTEDLMGAGAVERRGQGVARPVERRRRRRLARVRPLRRRDRSGGEDPGRRLPDRPGLAADHPDHERQAVDDRVDRRGQGRALREVRPGAAALPARVPRLTMRLAWGEEELAFRAELRAFLDEHAPPEALAGFDMQDTRAEERTEIVPQWARDWQATLFDHGWMIPAYPPELGGRNATPVQTLVYLEEMATRRIPRALHFPGYAIVAPSLLEFGNEEQRALVPAAIRGDTIWCIGMSEPNAGSDLAGPPDACRCSTATGSSSTARRCGRATRPSPRSASATCAPTPTRRSTRASAC